MAFVRKNLLRAAASGAGVEVKATGAITLPIQMSNAEVECMAVVNAKTRICAAVCGVGVEKDSGIASSNFQGVYICSVCDKPVASRYWATVFLLYGIASYHS
jgi:hypothetical protein